jgi:hypothetical protein
VLFTSRNKAAQGLQLQVTKREVGCLTSEAATRVLLAGGVQLDANQLIVALNFCKGLPLALELLNRALAAERSPAATAGIIRELANNGNFNGDNEEELISKLSFSVNCLSEPLQAAWLDMAWMFSQYFVTTRELQCLFGERTLQELQNRSLIALRNTGGLSSTFGEPMMEVVLHDIMRRMAERMCGPDSKNHCVKLSGTLVKGMFSQTAEVSNFRHVNSNP